MPDTPYLAVIELTPPQTQGRLTISITLRPADQVGSGASAKPLRDCTLLELQQYADELEQSFWSEHQNETLQSLLDDETIVVDFKLADGETIVEMSEDVLLSQVVIDPPSVEAADSAEAEETVEDEIDVDTVDVEIEEPVAPFLEETPIDEAIPEPIVTIVEPTVDEIEAIDSAEIVPPVDVDSASVLPEVRPVGRVAGGVRSNGNALNDAVDIMFDEHPFRAMQAHAVSSMRREVAGILVGPQPEKQPNGRYVVRVTDSIIAKHTRMSGASVTYTPESWRYLNDKLAELYPDGDAVIVGWYHTHPGFGIFLSGMDLFIHENFFTQPWHIAYVLDPVARRSGFFCWDKLQKRVKEFDLEWPIWSRNSW
jgi:proteasome lid subunit RPN8/RPN11